MTGRVNESVRDLGGVIGEKIIGYRRDFHRHAEAGWTEHRTASLVARRLVNLGLEVQAGRQVVRDEDRMGLPAAEVLEQHWQRAVEQGGDSEFLEAVRGGFTGVVGILRNGDGPTVGLRFDREKSFLPFLSAQNHEPEAVPGVQCIYRM